MNIEVKNIEYDLTINGEEQTPSEPLPITAEVEVDSESGIVGQIIKAVERDWLIKGFDYRVDGEWRSYRDDMKWRKPIEALDCDDDQPR